MAIPLHMLVSPVPPVSLATTALTSLRPFPSVVVSLQTALSLLGVKLTRPRKSRPILLPAQAIVPLVPPVSLVTSKATLILLALLKDIRLALLLTRSNSCVIPKVRVRLVAVASWPAIAKRLTALLDPLSPPCSPLLTAFSNRSSPSTTTLTGARGLVTCHLRVLTVLTQRLRARATLSITSRRLRSALLVPRSVRPVALPVLRVTASMSLVMAFIGFRMLIDIMPTCGWSNR